MIVACRVRDILQTGEVSVVVCSTRAEPPFKPTEVLLPWDPEAKERNALPEQTIAICDWTAILPAKDIHDNNKDGLITGDLLRQIYRLAGIIYVSER